MRIFVTEVFAFTYGTNHIYPGQPISVGTDPGYMRLIQSGVSHAEMIRKYL